MPETTCRECPHIGTPHAFPGDASLDSAYCEVSDSPVLLCWHTCEFRREEIEKAAAK